jgi:hypothetical protein
MSGGLYHEKAASVKTKLTYHSIGAMMWKTKERSELNDEQYLHDS